MPQPMRPKVGQDFYNDPRDLESRPACAIKMATVARAWVGIETALALWFSWAVSDPHQTAPDALSLKSNQAFKAALTAIENLHLRLAVIRAAMEDRFTEGQREGFEKLAQELRARAGERNLVVHTEWITSTRYPNDVLRRDGDRWMRYTADDFEAMIQRITLAEAAIVLFTSPWVNLSAMFGLALPEGQKPEA